MSPLSSSMAYATPSARSNSEAIEPRTGCAEGFRAGDRLCVYLSNCVEMIDLYLACVKVGVIFVPINILYRGREIAHILSDAEPSGVISDAAIECDRDPVWTRADLAEGVRGPSADRPRCGIDGDSPAGIIYTSGTTGARKAPS